MDDRPGFAAPEAARAADFALARPLRCRRRMSHSIVGNAESVLIITTSIPIRDDEPTIKTMTEPSPLEDEDTLQDDERTRIS